MKRWIYGVVTALLLGSFTGCAKAPAPEEAKEEGVYQIYYLNSSMTKLEPQAYRAQAEPGDTQALIAELVGQVMTVPKDLDRQTPVPDKVALERYDLEEEILYLYFDNNYALMEPAREIMCRAGLAKTLTQAGGADYVSIYTADQPIMDSSGSPVGLMGAGDFIDNTSDVNTFQKTELTLYFTDGAGEKLIQEKREVVHSVNTSLEKLVVEQLIEGPDRPGLSPTLPKDTKLLNVTVNENVCYLNFDPSFLNSTLEVKEYIPIYSIVNSLAEVSAINKVQITVNGSQDVMFRDSVPLNTPFERNLDYNADNGETGGAEEN